MVIPITICVEVITLHVSITKTCTPRQVSRLDSRDLEE